MPFAVIGVCLDATDDGPDAVHCIRHAIPSREEANAFREQYEKTEESRARYDEVYIERYDGERWRAAGGRCFIQAVRFFIAKYQQVLDLRHLGKTPMLVHGSCDLLNPQGGTERSGHAWIEGENAVLDCGSYILKPTLLPKDRFYQEKNARRLYAYTREEAERHYRDAGCPYPWDRPPEELPRDLAVWEAIQGEGGS
jgi:hypothetical protein